METESVSKCSGTMDALQHTLNRIETSTRKHYILAEVLAQASLYGFGHTNIIIMLIEKPSKTICVFGMPGRQHIDLFLISLLFKQISTLLVSKIKNDDHVFDTVYGNAIK